MPSKAHLTIAAVAIAAVVLVAAFQRHVMAVPVVGDYLPK